MDDRETPKTEFHGNGYRGFFASLFGSIIRDAVNLVVAFAVGTGGGAIVCWYYGMPIVFSILGGILVLGLALALSTDSLFS